MDDTERPLFVFQRRWLNAISLARSHNVQRRARLFFFQWLGLPPPLPAHRPASLFGLQRLVLLSVYGLRGVTDATLAALARPGRCSTTLTTLDVHGCCNVSVLTKAAGLSRLFFSRGHFVAQCFGHLTSGGGPCLGTLQVKRQSEVGLLELFPKLTCFTHHS